MLHPIDCSTPLKAEKQEKPAIKNLQQLLQAAKSSYPKLVSSQGEEIELPESVYKALYQVVEALVTGTSITISPVDTITIEETAEILNVSKDYVNKLLQQGNIPYTTVGTTKQINYRNVLEYQQVRNSQRRKSLDELANFMQQEGFYD